MASGRRSPWSGPGVRACSERRASLMPFSRERCVPCRHAGGGSPAVSSAVAARPQAGRQFRQGPGRGCRGSPARFRARSSWIPVSRACASSRAWSSAFSCQRLRESPVGLVQLGDEPDDGAHFARVWNTPSKVKPPPIAALTAVSPISPRTVAAEEMVDEPAADLAYATSSAVTTTPTTSPAAAQVRDGVEVPGEWPGSRTRATGTPAPPISPSSPTT